MSPAPLEARATNLARIGSSSSSHSAPTSTTSRLKDSLNSSRSHSMRFHPLRRALRHPYRTIRRRLLSPIGSSPIPADIPNGTRIVSTSLSTQPRGIPRDLRCGKPRQRPACSLEPCLHLETNRIREKVQDAPERRAELPANSLNQRGRPSVARPHAAIALSDPHTAASVIGTDRRDFLIESRIAFRALLPIAAKISSSLGFRSMASV